MATYYVRPDGNDGNTGTGSASNQAWRTIQKALGASGIGSGDTVYIAPGLYGEQVTIGGTYSATTYITGDPTASQFSGVSAGRVQIGAFNNLGTAPIYTGNTIVGTSKNNLYFSSIEFLLSCGSNFANAGIAFATSQNNTFDRCIFQQCNSAAVHLFNASPPTSSALNLTVKNCAFIGSALGTTNYLVVLFGQDAVTDTTSFTNCIFQNHHTALYLSSVTTSITNCTFTGLQQGIQQVGSRILTLRNSLFYGCVTGAAFTSSSTGTQTYCRYVGCGISFSGAASSATSSVVGTPGIENYYSLLTGTPSLQPVSSIFGSPNTGFGVASGAPATDMYGVTWTGATPDAGSATYRNISSVGSYLPSERNASTITIAPGSTSQSIELYLGATGLTASTSGLSARYNRTRTASVSIPLVARTIAQAWTSGGFAEVDATNMPGIYRLDLPDAALAAGADDVTVVMRGASGTNGAVMTVKLSSGGLTSAQTASAVWDAATASYTANGTFGLNVLRADQQNKAGNVTLSSANNVNRVDADVHAIANDIAAATALKGALNHDGTGYIDSDIVRISTSTAAADELEGALLHNGTDYISAELLTPVSAATSVHIGPYQLLADGLGADQPLDVNVGTATSIDVQVTDANGTGIDITGATVSAKVYNSGGTLVATYAGTATYADNGRLTFGLTTTVTNTSGTYTVTVTRTTGASDTQVFGPLKLYVRPV